MTAALVLVVGQAAVAEPTSPGLQGSSSLNGAKLEPARLRPSKLEPSRLEAAKKHKDGPAFKKVLLDFVRGGFSSDKLQGVVTSIPASRLGELFFDVAGEIERQELRPTATAVGYYMAALTDPKGQRFKEAKQRILEIVLQDGLTQEQAAHLYDGGIATFTELFRLKVGITREGVDHSLRELQKIKTVYQLRSARELSAPDTENE